MGFLKKEWVKVDPDPGFGELSLKPGYRYIGVHVHSMMLASKKGLRERTIVWAVEHPCMLRRNDQSPNPDCRPCMPHANWDASPDSGHPRTDRTAVLPVLHFFLGTAPSVLSSHGMVDADPARYIQVCITVTIGQICPHHRAPTIPALHWEV